MKHAVKLAAGWLGAPSSLSSLRRFGHPAPPTRFGWPYRKPERWPGNSLRVRSHELQTSKPASRSRPLELASPEAGKIALRGGSADVIVSDWLWVSRERQLGAKLTFYPYSNALGAVMVPDASPIKTLADL